MDAESIYRLVARLSRNPGAVTVTGAIVGTGILGFLASVRDQRAARRKEALEFTKHVAMLLNPAFSRLFGAIRSTTAVVPEELDEAVGNLFEERLSIRLTSETVFRTELFWRSYDTLVWQLSDQLAALRRLNAGGDERTCIELAQRHLTPKQKAVVAGFKSELKSPRAQFEAIAENVWVEAACLLGSALHAGLGLHKLKRLREV